MSILLRGLDSIPVSQNKQWMLLCETFKEFPRETFYHWQMQPFMLPITGPRRPRPPQSVSHRAGIRSFEKHTPKNSFCHHLQDKVDSLWHVTLKEFLCSYRTTWAGPSLISIPEVSLQVFSRHPEHQRALPSLSHCFKGPGLCLNLGGTARASSHHYSLAMACFVSQCPVIVGPGDCERQCPCPWVRKERKPFESEVWLRAGPGLSTGLFCTFLISETLCLASKCSTLGKLDSFQSCGNLSRTSQAEGSLVCFFCSSENSPGPVGLTLRFQAFLFSRGLLSRLGEVLGYKDLVKMQRFRQADDGRSPYNKVWNG